MGDNLLESKEENIGEETTSSLRKDIDQKLPDIRQSLLSVQDLSTLDPSRLTALTPEVISRQATINIGSLHNYLKKFKNKIEKSAYYILGFLNCEK